MAGEHPPRYPAKPTKGPCSKQENNGPNGQKELSWLKLLTHSQLVQFNDRNLSDEEVSDLLQDAPLMAALHAQPASNGTLHKYLKQTTASSAAFRAANAGLDKTFSEDTLVTDTLAILDGSFHVDVALADEAKIGADAYLERELMRTMRTVMFAAEQQVFYGVASPGDSTGFPGLRDNGQLDALTDAMVNNAGGGTASEQTSCYLLRSGAADVSFILGNNGVIVVDEDPKIVPWVASAGASPTFPAYYIPVTGFSGFQIGGAYSAARIANIHPTDNAGANALDDDMIYDALALFPAGRQPNLICMNRAAHAMLRKSRTAVNVTGAPAPLPTEVNGIQIVVTDGLVSTEAVET